MLIQQLTLKNILSFGPDTEPLELRPLNIVIGANGSGKSNLLEVIDLLRNAPEQIARPIREGGGISDWLWKGGEGTPTASVDVVFGYPRNAGRPDSDPCFRYVVAFTEVGQRFQIADERIETARCKDPLFHYRFRDGHPEMRVWRQDDVVELENIDAGRSILAQRRDPDQFPTITYLAETLPKICVYNKLGFGRGGALRLPQKTDMPNEMLESDGSNLALVLNRLRRFATAKAQILEALRKLYDGIEDFDVQFEGGTVLVFLHERGMTIPASRLSDGTLRYLCLLAILCHPHPPPLVCIEEPELGLHPDILPTIADLLREASERCQLIVTTHSDVLVDCMHDTPENVLVCEKHDGATTMKRLSATDLKPWLERYRLGDLWTSGQIGGTRW